MRDEANAAVLRYWYKDGYYQLFDEEILKMTDIVEVFSNLTTDLKVISRDKLNNNEKIINFKNGILGLKTMKILPHNPRYYSIIQIPREWAEIDEPTPVFNTFMNDLTQGDKEIQRLVMQFI